MGKTGYNDLDQIPESTSNCGYAKGSAVVTAPGEWIHIAGDAWELYGTGAHYTLHKESGEWVTRRFWLSQGGDETADGEESSSTMDEAKHIVHRWESRR